MVLRALLRNRSSIIGMIILGIMLFIAIFAPFLSKYDPEKPLIGIEKVQKRSPPCIHLLGCPENQPQHLFGIDGNVRDVFSRVLYGARLSLIIGFTTVSFAIVIGTLLGLLSGYLGGAVDNAIMRAMDVLLSFPSMVTALTIVSILGPGINNLVFAIAIYQIPQFARLTHGQTLTVKSTTYVTAALSVGVPNARILYRHILPNIVASIIVQISLLIPSAVMMTAGLSFLGLGVTPPTAEWGSMLQDSLKYYYRAPHLMIYPGLALMMVVFGFNTFGDGLRISLDPRMRGRF